METVEPDPDELAHEIRRRLVAGFWDYSTALEFVQDWVADTGAPDTASATALLRSLYNDRLVEQSTWRDTGDFGRLQRVFAQLGSEGVLARMSFTCCMTCGTAEIDAERTLHPDPPDWYPYREWAYTFFHDQDAERLADPDPSLYLAYSAFRGQGTQRHGDARIATMLGERIVQLLRHFELEATWSGSHLDRIEVLVPQWRKPLPR